MTLKAMKAIVVNPSVYSSRFVSFKAFSSGGGGSAMPSSSGRVRVSVASMLNAEQRRGARWIARGAGGDSVRAVACAALSSQRLLVAHYLLSRLAAGNACWLRRAYGRPVATD